MDIKNFIRPAPQLTELILNCLETLFECLLDSRDQSCQPINEPQIFQTHMIGPQECSGPYRRILILYERRV